MVPLRQRRHGRHSKSIIADSVPPPAHLRCAAVLPHFLHAHTVPARGIRSENLSQKLQKQAENGIGFADEESLFDFLESYSS